MYQISKNEQSDHPKVQVFKFRTGGKPSTWFPPGGLVEHIRKKRKRREREEREEREEKEEREEREERAK